MGHLKKNGEECYIAQSHFDLLLLSPFSPPSLSLFHPPFPLSSLSSVPFLHLLSLPPLVMVFFEDGVM